ncbi:hypothetical protein [Roseobacter litoralis]|uniref:hypothetical protein n=1 Tax=Roseobacter litoralis TaxID=42443 RepID=UPI0024948E79|nr:hypothetical protein [Roseobacter litoralis]
MRPTPHQSPPCCFDDVMKCRVVERLSPLKMAEVVNPANSTTDLSKQIADGHKVMIDQD